MTTAQLRQGFQAAVELVKQLEDRGVKDVEFTRQEDALVFWAGAFDRIGEVPLGNSKPQGKVSRRRA
jgi:hypothetical protein